MASSASSSSRAFASGFFLQRRFRAKQELKINGENEPSAAHPPFGQFGPRFRFRGGAAAGGWLVGWKPIGRELRFWFAVFFSVCVCAVTIHLFFLPGFFPVKGAHFPAFPVRAFCFSPVASCRGRPLNVTVDRSVGRSVPLNGQVLRGFSFFCVLLLLLLK